MDNKLNSKLSALKDNAVFQLSMTSKELFHSNFLYWLGTTKSLRPFFKAVINDMCGNKQMDWNNDQILVLREHKNLDFCICKDAGKNKAGKQKIGDILFVLENKFKSIATMNQLNRYAEKCQEQEGRHIAFILLSLAEEFIERGNIERGGVWGIISYQKYADLLRTHLKLVSSTDKDFNKLLIENYIDFIDTFSKELNEELANNVKDLENAKWESIIGHPIFDDLRCCDIWQKVMMHKMAQILASKLEEKYVIDFDAHDDQAIFEDKEKSAKKLYVGVNLLHGQALVGVSCPVDENHIFTLQQQGCAELRLGVIVRNREKMVGCKKPNMKQEPKKHRIWKEKVSKIIGELHLEKYVQPYRIHKNDPDDTYGVFDNTVTSFYYGKCKEEMSVKKTLDYMVKVIDEVAQRTTPLGCVGLI